MAYDPEFFDVLNAAGSDSAAAVLPLILEAVRPRTAIDVGCGTGIWTHELGRLGVDAVGVDGAHVPRDRLRIDAARFLEADLEKPLRLLSTYDLALCLEVAEHLPALRARSLVADLCTLAPAVAFSAATPKQGGVHHVNEQWLDYWIALFAEQGFRCWDVARPRVRYDRRVAWIYRQNLVLFLAAEHEGPRGVEELLCPDPGDVAFDYVARYIVEREDSAMLAVRRAIGRRLRRRG